MRWANGRTIGRYWFYIGRTPYNYSRTRIVRGRYQNKFIEVLTRRGYYLGVSILPRKP